MLLLFACADPEKSDTLTADLDAPFTLGDVQACDSPVAPSWQDEAEARGLTGRSVPGDHLEGGAMVWADFDGDGSDDLLIFFNGDGAMLYRWPEGQPMQRVPFAAEAWAPLWIERGDSWQLWLGGPMAAMLNWNGMIFSYEDLPSMPDWYVIGTSSAKQFIPMYINGDALLDLFVVLNGGAVTLNDPIVEDFVLLGTADGGWELGAPLGLPARRRGFDGMWVPPSAAADASAEGLLHRVHVTNDMGPDYGGDIMWAVEDGYLLERTGNCACGVVQSFMAGQTADVDGDGTWDLLISGTGTNLLLQGQPDGSFVDVTTSTGFNTITDRLGMAWGMAAEDMDNDGQREIAVLQGDFWGGTIENPNVVDWPTNLLRREGESWVDIGAESGMPQVGSYRSVLPRDVNADGVLDLLISQVDGRPAWLISEGCTEAGWLEVEGPEGAWLELEAGGRLQVGRLTADVSYGVTAKPLAHFGLGAAQTVDRLTVHLPDGTVMEGGGFEGRRRVRVP